MKEYIVGGFVRDKLLNRESHDIDYVVVGATIQDMLDLGYKQVGKEFPVFLDNDGCEHALARKEKSTGDEYTAFEFDFTPDITLEEDLMRRDFSVNTLCLEQDANGNYVKLVDLFNGKQDLDNKRIRHVSEHFVEDPLRVLRAIRFATTLGFGIVPKTIGLCTKMCNDGMLSALTPERVWKEIEKSLNVPNFQTFLYYALVCDALPIILPEVAALLSVPEKIEYHPEGTSFNHVKLVLEAANNISVPEEQRGLFNFMCLCHDLGKTQTREVWPAHHDHEELGLNVIDELCDRLKVPNIYRDMAKLGCKYHMRFYQYLKQNIKTHYDMLYDITRFKKENYWKLQLLLALHKADLYGRLDEPSEERKVTCEKVIDQIEKEFNILKDKTLVDLPEKTQQDLSKYKGEQFGKLYRDAMISYLKVHL